nr:D445 [uncultured bacterium]
MAVYVCYPAIETIHATYIWPVGELFPDEINFIRMADKDLLYTWSFHIGRSKNEVPSSICKGTTAYP